MAVLVTSSMISDSTSSKDNLTEDQKAWSCISDRDITGKQRWPIQSSSGDSVREHAEHRPARETPWLQHVREQAISTSDASTEQSTLYRSTDIYSIWVGASWTCKAVLWTWCLRQCVNQATDGRDHHLYRGPLHHIPMTHEPMIGSY